MKSADQCRKKVTLLVIRSSFTFITNGPSSRYLSLYASQKMTYRHLQALTPTSPSPGLQSFSLLLFVTSLSDQQPIVYTLNSERSHDEQAQETLQARFLRRESCLTYAGTTRLFPNNVRTSPPSQQSSCGLLTKARGSAHGNQLRRYHDRTFQRQDPQGTCILLKKSKLILTP